MTHSVTLAEPRALCRPCYLSDDGPRGIPRVPAVVDVDGTPCCRDCARDLGATEHEIRRALGDLECACGAPIDEGEWCGACLGEAVEAGSVVLAGMTAGRKAA